MKIIVVAVSLVLASSSVSAEQIRPAVKHFSSWITDVEYDSTNDCYVLRYNPEAKRYVRVYTKGTRYEPQKVQPGESYVLARGMNADFTRLARAGCDVTFTNGVTELRGVALPAEIRDSQRQLLVEGDYAVDRDVVEWYAFAVNAEGVAYDVMALEGFHFGFPFHAPEDKTTPKLDQNMEKIQRTFRKEGVEAYNKALADPGVMSMKDVVKVGVTNAVSFVEELVGIDEEEARKCIRESNSDYAALIRKMESRKRRIDYVVYCASESGLARIVAVARVGDGPKCRMWSYEGGEEPRLIYSKDCQRFTGSYYEYGDDGLLRNLCLFKNGRITSYSTMLDGVLQVSSDSQKAQMFISKVEEMFKRYVELDTTGTLKSFVDKVKSCDEHAKGK